jgi:micrococcal nuclease
MSQHSRIAGRRYFPQLLRTGLVGTAFVLIGIGAVILYRQTGGLDVVKVTGLVDRMTTSAYAPQAAPDFAGAVAPRPMPICGSGRRINCVVDGDTVWLDGEKIRLVNIDAPEVKARCNAERQRANAATRELAALLHSQPIRVHRRGEDRYGRTLADLATPAGDVGDILVRRDLAVTWRGRREPVETWCGA